MKSENAGRLQEVIAEREILRKALIGLIGVESPADLNQMELQLRTMNAPDADIAASINAIHALLKTTTDEM